jgi:hypothetical protein
VDLGTGDHTVVDSELTIKHIIANLVQAGFPLTDNFFQKANFKWLVSYNICAQTARREVYRIFAIMVKLLTGRVSKRFFLCACLDATSQDIGLKNLHAVVPYGYEIDFEARTIKEFYDLLSLNKLAFPHATSNFEVQRRFESTFTQFSNIPGVTGVLTDACAADQAAAKDEMILLRHPASRLSTAR